MFRHFYSTNKYLNSSAYVRSWDKKESKSSDVMKKPQTFETISHFIWHLISKQQVNWEIVSKFVAFLENLNFKCMFYSQLSSSK